jgi:hypothetical protein
VLLGAAAFRGWRDAAVREERGGRVTRRVALTALVAAVVALAAFWVLHGAPKGL